MDVKECESQKDLANSEEISCFDWRTDSQNAPIPQTHYVEQHPMHYPLDGLPRGFSHIDYPLVQRDPRDIIRIKKGTENFTIIAHANTWKYTFDQYLNQYVYLRNLQNVCLGKAGYVKVRFPHDVIGKYFNNERASKSRKKELFFDLSEFEHLEQNGEASENSYLFPRFGVAASFNLFCRSLDTRPNATLQILTPRHDGIRYELGKATYFVPDFSVEDYYLHECVTGISLSIEITSILLEAREKEPNKELWNKAFRGFCQKALPTIVRSNFLFTRNAVARLFFQQVLLEQTIHNYQCTESAEPIWKNEKSWNGVMERAAFHIRKLENMPRCYDVAEDQIDKELSYIESILSEMKDPIDIVSYVKKPKHGLAIFCNKNHKGVSSFLHELTALSTEGETRVGNRYRAASDTTFQMVHKEVKEAIRFIRDLHKYRENEQIEEIEIQDKILPIMWETYSAFANTEGGMVVLKRSLALKSSKIWVPEMYTNRKRYKKHKNKYGWWDQDASTIVEKILSVANDTQKVSRNVLSEEDIRVWELEGYEMIVVRVPPKKKKQGWVYIGSDPRAGMYIREKNKNCLMPRN